jgi:hypothetical protein
MSTAARTLPVQIQEILEDIRKGRLSVETRGPSLERAVERLGRRVFTGAFTGSLVLSASVLFATDHWYAGGAMLAAAAGGLIWHRIAMVFSGKKSER